jgi:hypothetical protein
MGSRIRAMVSVFVGALVLAPVSAYAAGVAVVPGAAKADAFLPSSACTCHSARVSEFSTSMHSKAITDKVFLTKVGQAQAQAGKQIALFCKRCHTPIGNMTSDPSGAGAAAHEGVTCMFCHQVSGMAPRTPHNVSQLLTPDLTRRAQIKDPQAPHPAVYSVLHTSAELCGGCHNVDNPVTGVHLESTYTEWKNGPYAADGIVCQDCHMSSDPGKVIGPSSSTAADGGPQRDNIFAMSFAGANVGQGSPGAANLLKSAAGISVAAPDVLAPGSNATVTVTVTNRGAGHYLPTGLTEVRQMRLVVSARAGSGGVTQIGERVFGTVLKDAKGRYPAEMWAAAGVQSDDRIPPKKSVDSVFSFTLPAGADSASIVAVLEYRSVPVDLASAAGVADPVTEMASAKAVVYASAAAKQAAAAKEASVAAPASGSGGSPVVVYGLAVLLVAIIVGYLIVRARKGR